MINLVTLEANEKREINSLTAEREYEWQTKSIALTDQTSKYVGIQTKFHIE